MSSHVPNNQTFNGLLTFIKQHFDYHDDKSPIQGYQPVGDTELFAEKLMNLCIKSVNKQYKDNSPTMEIFKDWIPVKTEIDIFQAITICDYINYQIENEDLDIETFAKFQTLRVCLMKVAFKKELAKNERQWGL
jgi:hypothetical protein